MKWLYEAWRSNDLYDWGTAGLLVAAALLALAVARFGASRIIGVIAMRTASELGDHVARVIARTQLWQWLHTDGLHLDDGSEVDLALFERALINLPMKLGDRSKLPGGSRINEAIGMLDRLTHADTLEEFLTLPAYARLD